MPCFPGNRCCARCQGFGAAFDWLDPRAVLAAYETASVALDRARAQRPRMTAQDLQFLADLEAAWEALPPRTLMAQPLTNAEMKAAAVQSALQLAGTLDALAERVAARAGASSPAVTTTAPSSTQPAGGGWSLPSLPSWPGMPDLGIKPDWLLIAAALVALGFLGGGGAEKI